MKRAKLYARLAIPEYWLVDLLTEWVVVHRDVVRKGQRAKYRRAEKFRPGAMVASTAVEDLTIETDFLLQLAG